ncbi:hypothetical protein ABE527_21495, partial [Brucella sp. TWI432]
MSAFTTNAGNFGPAENSSVDPRTGLFGATVELANLVGNKGKGPHLGLSIGYDPLSVDDYGFGRGWRFNWTTYDEGSDGRLRRLYSADGGVYGVEGAENFTLTQQKITSAKLSRFDGVDAYRVGHVGGGVEVLAADNSGLWYPSTLFSPLGEQLNLTWVKSEEVHSKIASISDNDGQFFMRATYDDGDATLTFFPDSTTACFDVVSVQKQGMMQHLTIGEREWIFSYDFSYDDGFGDSVAFLTKVQHPTGLIEEVSYRSEAQAFPSAMGRTALPCAKTYTKTIQAGQPSQLIEYDFAPPEYHGHNYLGYGGSFPMTDNAHDNLYNCDDADYKYSMVETTIAPDGHNLKKQLVFNKYHLIESETLTHDTCVHVKKTEYSYSSGTKFDDLPLYYNKPSRITKQFIKNDIPGRLITDTFTYNDDGTRASHTADDGTRTDWTYYDRNTEDPNCPVSPEGLLSYMKSKTVTTPQTTGLDGDVWPGEVERTEYSYTKLSTGGSPDDETQPVSYAVLKSQEKQFYQKKLIRQLDTTYFKDSSSALNFGRVQTETETFYGEDKKSYPYTATYTYSYDSSLNVLSITKKLQTFDTLSAQTIERHSCLTGRLCEAVDQLGVSTTYEYDIYGQETKRTLANGTSNARTYQLDTTFEDSPLKDDTKLPVKTLTTPDGNKVRRWYDGSLRPWREEVLVEDTWLTGKTYAYNWLGKTAALTYSDYDMDKVSDDKVSHGLIIHSSVQYSYDNWGSVSSSVESSGYTETQINDPIGQTVTYSWSDGSKAAKVTTYDNRGLPLSEETLGADGTSISKIKQAYDGAGRLREHVDGKGRKTTYSYDSWGRVVRTGLPDGSVVIKSYVPYSTQSLACSLQIQKPGTTTPVDMGQQTFDGLDRLKTVTNGGRQWR